MPGATWCLVQYLLPGAADVHLGVLTEGRVVAPPEQLQGRTLMSVLADWEPNAAVLMDWSPSEAATVPGAALTAPLTYPGKVLCSGANYYSHASEMGTAIPDPDSEPFFFLKPPTTTVVGPYDPVPFPPYASLTLDWEVELAVVIGVRAKDVTPEQARRHVAGYLAANDLSARDRASRTNAVSPHFVYDWLGHKGQDGFCPLGPGLVPVWQVPDPQDLALHLSVNGVTKQDASTADMVIGVDRLVAGASRTVTLEPGDVILTGTPAGVGAPRGEFLKLGDTVVIDISGIGRLSNQLVAASSAGPGGSSG